MPAPLARPTRRSAAPPRRQRGSALVELALVMVPLVLLLTATADFGRALYTYNALAKAVRGAARHLALADPADAPALAQAQEEALNLVLYGDTAAGDTTLAPGLKASMVKLCTPANSCPDDHSDVSTGNGGSVNLVSVSVVGYRYPALFSAVLPAGLAFSTIGQTMRQRP